VNAFQRKFINEVRRCDEMERKLRYLNTELEKAGIEIRPSAAVEAPDPQSEDAVGGACRVVSQKGLGWSHAHRVDARRKKVEWCHAHRVDPRRKK